MEKRKSKLIGQTINGFEILDSYYKERAGTYLIVKCIHCNKKQEKYHSHLTRNKAKCDCQKENIHNSKGYTKTRLYKIYLGILSRTSNSHRKAYKNYGERGIKMCEEWKNDFIKFYEWSMKNGYQENLSIERINVNGNYEPSNCKWITLKEQANNKRNSHFITYKGETKTLAQWAFKYDIKYTTLIQRIRNGWDIEKALTTPIRRGNYRRSE